MKRGKVREKEDRTKGKLWEIKRKYDENEKREKATRKRRNIGNREKKTNYKERRKTEWKLKQSEQERENIRKTGKKWSQRKGKENTQAGKHEK